MREPDDMVAAHFRRSCETLDRAADDMALRGAIHAIADAITKSFRDGGKLLIAGNGGSAADAQHIAGEFLSRLNFDRNPLPAIALDDRFLGADRDRQRLWVRARRSSVKCADSAAGRRVRCDLDVWPFCQHHRGAAGGARPSVSQPSASAARANVT